MSNILCRRIHPLLPVYLCKLSWLWLKRFNGDDCKSVTTDGGCFPSQWTPVYLNLRWRVVPHPPRFVSYQYPELICYISLQNYNRMVQVVHRDVQPTWTRHNTKPLHTPYFHRLKRNFTMLAECIHMDRRKIYALPWIWSSIEWYNWWAFSCYCSIDTFIRFLIDSPLIAFIVFSTKRCV